LASGGLAVDLAKDVGETFDRVRREDADVTCYGLGLDAACPDGVLYSVNRFV
jgi:hypothetical protein